MSPREVPPNFCAPRIFSSGGVRARPTVESGRRRHPSQQRTRTTQPRMHEMSSRPPRTDQSTDRLGRFLALVLRHKPESIGISLDPAGFVEVEALARAIATQPGWSSVTADSIRAATQKDAKRYEISGDRVRARYGHSVPISAPGKAIVPPEWLYHGTAPGALEALRQQGLQPQGRQFVHLSVTRQDALSIGQRHSPDAVVVTVQARGAHDTGILFYLATPTVYLVREVPPMFLRVPSERPNGT